MSNHFITALKKTRKALNKSQEQVAEKLGLSRSAYTYYELGYTKPTCEFIINVSKAMNVDYCLFMNEILKDMIEDGHLEGLSK